MFKKNLIMTKDFELFCKFNLIIISNISRVPSQNFTVSDIKRCIGEPV